jgi:hypothetical protein
VRRLVEENHVAPSQDALVERAIRLYERHLRDVEDQARWAVAASDPEFQAEQARIWVDFERDDGAAFDG